MPAPRPPEGGRGTGDGQAERACSLTPSPSSRWSVGVACCQPSLGRLRAATLQGPVRNAHLGVTPGGDVALGPCCGPGGPGSLLVQVPDEPTPARPGCVLIAHIRSVNASSLLRASLVSAGAHACRRRLSETRLRPTLPVTSTASPLPPPRPPANPRRGHDRHSSSLMTKTVPIPRRYSLQNRQRRRLTES